MPPFSGTKELYEDENKILEGIDIDDEVWAQDKTEKIKIPISNSLGALIGAYRSSDESDEEIYVPKQVPESSKQNKVQNKTIEDQCEVTNKPQEEFDPPEEVKIIKEDESEPVKIEDEATTPNPKTRKRKRQHNKNKNTQLPNKKKFIAPNKVDQKRLPPETRFRKRKVTLLERLLEPEIRHERNVILQCIRYIVKNNFFDKSEQPTIEVSNEDATNIATSELAKNLDDKSISE